MAPQNRGILKIAQGKAVLATIPIPKIPDNFILVKTVAVALNPTDWQTVDEKPKAGIPPSLLGCDAAGIVVEVGKGVTKDFKPGDRIAGFSHGGNDLHAEYGCFANYILVKGDVAMHIPPGMSFEDAATLPCGVGTCCLGMYKELGLPWLSFPLEEKKAPAPTLLIYGGSSASGTLAIQYAKLSGLKVITTASPRNFDLLKNLGADHVFDYHDPACGAAIRELTKNDLHLVFDTIATASTAAICAEALSSSPGGLYVALLPVEFPREDVKNVFFLGYTLGGEVFEIEGEVWPAVPDDFELSKKFVTLTEKLLEQGKIKPHPADVRDGIENILDGMQEMKDGKHSGVKLVYRIGTVE
ncbi:ACT-toxin biosynthesis S2 [Hyphodiscus hymeniophilus]|uniref:ACT-toxin biosynthesis S2 n=1 Tax=Hyphodiscus hymeniophilus TaxID=353542 RepID=A0A9P6VLY4_9HELO|nr:ACT-toxin biosynthesis S2 [Hyphodiscus hymeniophilus]